MRHSYNYGFLAMTAPILAYRKRTYSREFGRHWAVDRRNSVA